MDDERTDRVSSPTVREGASRIEVAVADDFQRYESTAGWVPPDSYKKQREKIRKQQEKDERRSEPILHSPYDDEVRPAEQLFTTLWRTGEVALLFGEPGIGKTLFAVRLAEDISQGGNTNGRECAFPLEGQRPKAKDRPKVVYIDLQRTESQWNQRFPDTAFERLHFDWTRFDPEETDNIRSARIHHSISEAIDDGAEVVILDDIALGGINLCRPNGPLRTLRTLKMYAAERGTSFLVIAGATQRKRPRPASCSDVAFRHIAEQADSVFCLSASTYGPAFRYVRHLRSASAPIVHDASAVLTYQLGGVSSPSVNAGASSALTDHLPLTTQHLPLNAALTYLGTCSEEQHLFDYAAEALHAQRAEELQLKRLWKRSSKEILVDGILDGSYGRYLKGE